MLLELTEICIDAASDDGLPVEARTLTLTACVCAFCFGSGVWLTLTGLARDVWRWLMQPDADLIF